MLDRLNTLKRIVKEARNIIAWQVDINTALHNIDATWVVSGVLALARIPNIDWGRISANFPRTIAELLSDHNLANHPLVIIPVMDWAHISGLFPRTIADILSNHNLANHPLAIIPVMDWAHISGLFPRTIADLLSNHNLVNHPLAIIPTMDDGHIPDLETLSYGGAFAVAQIPSLPAAQITSGQFPLSRMPRAASGLFLEGNGAADPIFNALVAANIPNLDAAKITTGVLLLARIPNMDWAHISGLFPRTIAALLSDHNLAHHGLGVIVPHDALASLTEKAHTSLTGVTANQHHTKYTDAEAVAVVKTDVEVGDLKLPTKTLAMGNQEINGLGYLKLPVGADRFK